MQPGVAVELDEEVLAPGRRLEEASSVSSAAPWANLPCGLLTCGVVPAYAAWRPAREGVQGVALRHGSAPLLGGGVPWWWRSSQRSPSRTQMEDRQARLPLLRTLVQVTRMTLRSTAGVRRASSPSTAARRSGSSCQPGIPQLAFAAVFFAAAFLVVVFLAAVFFAGAFVGADSSPQPSCRGGGLAAGRLGLLDRACQGGEQVDDLAGLSLGSARADPHLAALDLGPHEGLDRAAA